MEVAQGAVADAAAELLVTSARAQAWEAEALTVEAWVAHLLNLVGMGVLHQPMVAASAVATVEAATGTREALEANPGGRHQNQLAPTLGALERVSQVLFDQNTRSLAYKILPTIPTARFILATFSTLHDSFRSLLISENVFDMLGLGMSAISTSLAMTRLQLSNSIPIDSVGLYPFRSNGHDTLRRPSI